MERNENKDQPPKKPSKTSTITKKQVEKVFGQLCPQQPAEREATSSQQMRTSTESDEESEDGDYDPDTREEGDSEEVSEEEEISEEETSETSESEESSDDEYVPPKKRNRKASY